MLNLQNMRIAILAAGLYPRTPYPLYLLEHADILLCCDGALRAALDHGLEPRAVIGDMDSLCKTSARRFKGEIIKVEEQDYNDLTKVMRYVMERYPEAEEITILGATGKSEAHTIGNMSLLMQYEQWWEFWKRGKVLQIVSDYCTAFAVPDSVKLQVGEGRKISFFTTDTNLIIKTSGLQWPLDDVTFDSWWKTTLNRATSDEIELKFNHPAPVLIVLE